MLSKGTKKAVSDLGASLCEYHELGVSIAGCLYSLYGSKRGRADAL